MSSELIQKRVKVVWLDNGKSKVLIGLLLSFENGLISVKADSGQLFLINQNCLTSLAEYWGEWR